MPVKEGETHEGSYVKRGAPASALVQSHLQWSLTNPPPPFVPGGGGREFGFTALRTTCQLAFPTATRLCSGCTSTSCHRSSYAPATKHRSLMGAWVWVPVVVVVVVVVLVWVWVWYRRGCGS